MDFRKKILARLNKESTINPDQAVDLAAKKIQENFPAAPGQLISGLKKKDKTFIQTAIDLLQKLALKVQNQQESFSMKNISNILQNHLESGAFREASDNQKITTAKGWTPKEERMYKHIRDGYEEAGKSKQEAEELAARTVNKFRSEK